MFYDILYYKLKMGYPWSIQFLLSILHGKRNDFDETSKSLVRYRSENNFVGLSK